MLVINKINLFNIIIIVLLCNNKICKAYEYPDQFGFDTTSNSAYNEMEGIKNNLRKINFELDSLHSNLHLQSDLIHGIKSEILHKNEEKDQCFTSEFFEEIDNKLNKIKQHLYKVINENDDKHLDKMDSIIQNAKTTKTCGDDSNTAELEQIKTQISEKLNKFDHYTKRVEELEIKLEKLINPGDKKISEDVSNNKQLDLVNIINKINLKLSSQQEKFVQFEEHLNDMRYISSIVEKHLNKKRQKLRCQKGKYMLYHLSGMNNTLNLTKVN